MEIKNLNITKILKTTAIALVTGTMLATTTIGVMPTKVEASSITTNYDAMYYFTDTLQYNVYKYLNDDLTSNNLNKLLGYYDTLYDFINYNKNINNAYYRNLTPQEQDQLNFLLTTWGNEIYDLYNNKTYFKTNCKNKLGFTLKYDSQEIGYDIDHQEVMKYYTETQDKKLDTYLSNTNSEGNLKNALNIYKSLASFIKGSTKSYGCYFDELTLTEQEVIIHLIENWTYSIIGEYSTYNYYERVCRNTINYVVSVENLSRELGEYIYQDVNINTNFNPNISTTIVNSHDATIKYFTETQQTIMSTYIENHTEENLKNALNLYKVLWQFIKGENSVYGYTYSNLTNIEKQTIQELIVKWSLEIPNIYGCDANYIETCTSILGWTLTLENYYTNLAALNQTPVVNNPVVQTPTNPVVSVPSTTPVVTVPQNNINNTIGKDWRANYIDPSINTSRGVSDFVPEDLNDLENNWNNQNYYGSYDQYGNLIPYNGFNQYNNQDGYVEDYVPTLIP